MRREVKRSPISSSNRGPLPTSRSRPPDGYLLPRDKALDARLLDGDRARKFGRQYGDPETLLHRYQWLELHAIDVVDRAGEMP